MTTQATTPTPVPVCPYLGLADDPATHLVFPSHSQRCHATTRPSTIETAKQAKDCLTEAHTACSRYRPYPTPVPHGAVRAAMAAEALEPGHPTRPQGSGQRAPWTALVAAIIVLGLVGIVLGVGLASIMGGTPPAAGSPGPGVTAGTPPSPTRASTPAPSQTPIPTPTATPIPTLTATPPPSAEPTPTPAPTPLVHRVRRGETLTGIAERYSVTIEAIRKANGLQDPNLIVVGQLLVIPAR